MGAHALLQDLRRRGLSVAVKPGGETLLVTPSGVLTDAEHIAEWLQLRDRLCLDMAMCIECSRLEGRRCGAARTGQMTYTTRQFEPIRSELVRCECFKSNTRTSQ